MRPHLADGTNVLWVRKTPFTVTSSQLWPEWGR